MRCLLFIFLVLSASTLHAQDTVASPKASEEQIYSKVDVDASVDAAEWKKTLEAHLQPLIEKAAKKRMKAGVYIVNVRFLVEKDGSISDVKAMNDVGYGLAKGAEKVVRSGPRWKPGMYRGKPVRSYHTQPITFVISEE